MLQKFYHLRNQLERAFKTKEYTRKIDVAGERGRYLQGDGQGKSQDGNCVLGLEGY